MKNKVVFGPNKNTYGVSFLKTYIDQVEYYQTSKLLIDSQKSLKFDFSNDYDIAVYDYFEIKKTDIINFTNQTILVVETLLQLIRLVDEGKLDNKIEYIIISESCWDINQYQFDFKYKLFYLPWDIIDYQRRLTTRDDLYFHLIDLDMLDNYSPTYDFLCLIGMSKDWRNDFVDKLIELDLSNTITSYYGKNLGNEKLLELDIQYDRSGETEDFEKKFYNLNVINDTGHSYNLSYFVNMKLFHITKFSLIVETVAKHDEYHVTEKTLKCLILGHPFIVMGSYKYLDFLRQLGFKTYNEIFDESYDLISDISQRTDAVLKLTQQISNFDFDVQKLKEIQNHNLINLIKLRSPTIYKNFIDQVSK